MYVNYIIEIKYFKLMSQIAFNSAMYEWKIRILRHLLAAGTINERKEHNPPFPKGPKSNGPMTNSASGPNIYGL